MASEIRVNKIENRSGLGTVTFADTGVDLAGIVTATTFSGSGASLTNVPDSALSAVTASKLTGALPAISGASLTGMASTDNVRTGILDVAGIATFRDDIIVGAGVTISPDGDIYATGITTFAKQIVGISTNNLVPFLFNNYSDLPSASDYHGQFAHVHVAGKAFYAHAGAWYQLVNVGSELTVGLGTEKYNVGILTATSIKVGTGVTLSSDGDAFVTGVSTATKFVGDLSNAVTSRWVLGASGSSHYTFAGPGVTTGAQDPTIYLARGQTYEFDNQSGGSHPFAIRASDGGSNLTVAQGVINNAAASGVIRFEIPFSASNTLVYQCTSHSSMLGNIVVYPSI